MRVLYDVLYILAAVCFLLAFLGFTHTYRAGTAEAGTARSFNLVALGLFLWVLVQTIISLKAS